MKFYESGDSSKPVIFLFFYTVIVSYDGFDPNEKTEFYSMEESGYSETQHAA